MINAQTALNHHFFETAIAQRIPQMPADTQQNDVGVEMTPCEGILVVLAHEGNRFRSFLFTVSDQLSFLQHNPEGRHYAQRVKLIDVGAT
jgi:hypothetical protein